MEIVQIVAALRRITAPSAGRRARLTHVGKFYSEAAQELAERIVGRSRYE